MAVGKGSMERAAKAAGAKENASTLKKEAEGTKKTGSTTKKTSASGKTTSGRSTKKAAAAEKTGAKAVAAAEVIAAPSEEVLQQIIYQKSSGMLEREAEANEIFGLGDEMPVYYF